MMNNELKEVDGLGLKFGHEIESNEWSVWDVPVEYRPINQDALYKIRFKISEFKTSQNPEGNPKNYYKIYYMEEAPLDITEKYKSVKENLHECYKILYDNTKY